EWDWDRPGNIKELVARVNAIRRRHPALHFNDSLRFVETDNPELIAYTKSYGDDRLLIVVNLDPHHLQHGFVRSGPGEACHLLDSETYRRDREWNYVRLEPGVRQAHVFELRGRQVGRSPGLKTGPTSGG